MIARRFASLDHISGGRAGWNIVTTSNPDAALNFGLDENMEHDERYTRAREFYDVVTGLWDSFADDAFPRDVDSGLFFEPEKMRALNHKWRYLSVIPELQRRGLFRREHEGPTPRDNLGLKRPANKFFG